MTVRLRASVIPGSLTLTALGLTACASSGTVVANASGGTRPPGTASSSAAANTATGTASSDPAPPSGSTSTPPAAPGDSSATAPTSQDPSALASSLKTLNQLWTDQGCKTGLAGFSIYLYAQEQGSAQGIASIPNAIPKIREGAQQTKKPEAAQAMNKLAADLLTVYTQAQQGQTPNKGPIRSDFQHMGDVCSQQHL
jgi:hypothetical protein